MSASSSLLRLLHLASPALPIGGFHFSQGLEYAVEAHWVRDESSAHSWIAGIAEKGLGTLDLPVLARLHAAWVRRDSAAIEHWNAWLSAARETEELRAEDRHLGSALAKVLVELNVAGHSPPATPGYACMFALACSEWGVGAAETLRAYGWTWTENQVLAAIKLVPLGQSAGQRILHAMIPKLALIVERALDTRDEEIGFASVMQGVASARHELQYTRLFRS
jgi:urease accessory protein